MKFSIVLPLAGALLAAAGPLQQHPMEGCVPRSAFDLEECLDTCNDFLVSDSDPEQVSINRFLSSELSTDVFHESNHMSIFDGSLIF